MQSTDEKYMKEAIKQAEKSLCDGEVSVRVCDCGIR